MRSQNIPLVPTAKATLHIQPVGFQSMDCPGVYIDMSKTITCIEFPRDSDRCIPLYVQIQDTLNSYPPELDAVRAWIVFEYRDQVFESRVMDVPVKAEILQEVTDIPLERYIMRGMCVLMGDVEKMLENRNILSGAIWCDAVIKQWIKKHDRELYDEHVHTYTN